MFLSVLKRLLGAGPNHVAGATAVRSSSHVALYRHGDVFIAAVKAVPADAERRPGAILARGEATGHAHRISDPDGVQLFEGENAGGYLRVDAAMATLIHEEHKPITLPKGTYRFWIQREYSPKEIRRVVD